MLLVLRCFLLSCTDALCISLSLCHASCGHPRSGGSYPSFSKQALFTVLPSAMSWAIGHFIVGERTPTGWCCCVTVVSTVSLRPTCDLCRARLCSLLPGAFSRVPCSHLQVPRRGFCDVWSLQWLGHTCVCYHKFLRPSILTHPQGSSSLFFLSISKLHHFCSSVLISE